MKTLFDAMKGYPIDSRRARQCVGKFRYADKKAAKTAANARLRGHGGRGRPKSLRAYFCTYCAGWHLTKSK